ncbi:MAG: hypothetical protein ABI333_16570 [bacterium]
MLIGRRTHADNIFKADRARLLARAHLDVVRRRERMAGHLVAVAELRLQLLEGRARMAALGHPIHVSAADVNVARGELKLARLNLRFRGLNTELVMRQLRHAEAAYQHRRARHFEFVMEALQKAGHPSARHSRLNQPIRWATP